MTAQARRERQVATPNGTFIMLGAVITTNITPRGIRKQRCTKGPLVAGDGCRGSGGTSVLVEGNQCPLHGASISENSCREVCAEILACIPNIHADCSIFVLYMIKYIYTFLCLMLFMQRKESSYITLEKYAYAVLIRASLHQFHMYQRCSQLFCLPKRVTNIIILFRLNRKHLYSTITFWKEKNEIHRSRKSVCGEVKTALSCTSIVTLVQLQSKLIYIKKKSVCMLLLVTHTRLLDQIIQSKTENNQGCTFRKIVTRVCTFHTFLTVGLMFTCKFTSSAKKNTTTFFFLFFSP